MDYKAEAENFLEKKQNWRHKVLEPLASNLFRKGYDLCFRNINRLRSLRGQNVIVVPKHQHEVDVVLTGLTFRRAAWDPPYHIMKASLPKALQKMGGIPVARGRRDFEPLDLEDPKYREKRRKMLKKAREIETLVYDYVIPSALERGDSVVYFIEGTRHFQRNVQIPKSNLKKLHQVRDKIGSVVYVPLNIEYEAEKEEEIGPWQIPQFGKIGRLPFPKMERRGMLWRPLTKAVGPFKIPQRGTQIRVSVGKPVSPEKFADLGEHIAREVTLLSYSPAA